MSASCAECGDCCTVILIRHTAKELLERQQYMLDRPDDNDPDLIAQMSPWTTVAEYRHEANFLAEHWHPIPVDSAYALKPWAKEEIIHDKRYPYWCDQYEPETKRCLAYDHRPVVCQKFPWYQYGPNTTSISNHKTCSYWHDVPREQWPHGVNPLPLPTNCC